MPDTDTPLSAEILNAMQKGLMELVFPIGSTYITQSNTNPNEILGFGTWERLKGKVCLGVDEDDDDLDTIGNIGGEKSHQLTVSELASHGHKYKFSYGSADPATGFAHASTFSGLFSGDCIDNTGGDQPHNNMQPYEVVGYMWIRRS